MKIDMAEEDYFDLGMIISCTTYHGQKVEGEVIAFDYSSKMIALKSNAESGKPNTHDVRLVNLNLVSDVTVIQEATSAPAPLTNINVNKVMQRIRHNLEEKRRRVNYVGEGVTAEAQNIFYAITKTISEVKWDGQRIVVLDRVIISPPYQVENCRSNDGEQALQHVRKLVDKYHRDQEMRESSVSSSTSS